MNSLQRTSLWFNNLSIRERLLIAFTLLVFVLLPGYVIFIEPTLIKQAGAQIKIDRLTSANKERLQDIATLQRQPSSNINDDLAFEVERLKAKLQQLNSKDAENIDQLLSPAEANQALSVLLDSAKELTLLSFEKVAASPVDVGVSDAGVSSANSNVASLYRHPIELNLTGKTTDLLQFVTTIEKHQLPLFIERVQWTYGKNSAELYLRLYSFGLYPTWLGGDA